MTTAPESLTGEPSYNSTYNPSANVDADGQAYEWNCTDMLQSQLGEDGWTSGNYIGLVMANGIGPNCLFEDYQAAGTNEAWFYAEYLDVDNEEYNYVDNNSSDEDSSADIGTHSSFSDQQSAPDTTYDTLTEGNTGGSGNNYEDFVDQLGTSHLATPDIGTHSDWTELQDEDDTYDTMTEADTGDAGGTFEYIAESFTDVGTVWTSEGNAYDGNWGTTATSGNLASGDYYPSATAAGFDSSASGSGTITQVDIIIRTSVTGLSGSSDQWGITLDMNGGVTGTTLHAMDVSNYGLNNLTFTDVTEPNDGTWSWTDVRNIEIDFDMEKDRGSDGGTWSVYEMSVKVTVAGSTNYDLDLELGWTALNYDEDNVYLCIDAGTFSGESLRVDIWDEVSTNDWVNLDTAVTASDWNNWSIAAYINSGTVEIRFTDTSDEATAQDTWQIDCVLIHSWSADPNYELDLEVQWTTANYSRTNEYVCIKTGTLGAEDIKVYIWDEGETTWDLLWSDLTANAWNNISVSDWATSQTITLRFLGGTETGDSVTQDTWQIDSTVFRSYELAATEQNLYENITLDDNEPATVFDASRVFSEAIAVADTIVTAASIIIQLFESIAVAFSLATSRLFERVFGESLLVAENIATGIGFIRAFYEEASFTDMVMNSAAFARALFEEVSLTDMVMNTAAFSRAFYEEIVVADVKTTAIVIQQVFFESITIAATLGTVASYSRSLGEEVVVSGSIVNTAAFARAFYEEIVVTLTCYPEEIAGVTMKFLFETLTVAEQVVLSKAINNILYESITISSIISTSSAISRTLFDGMNISDIITNAAIFSRTLFEEVSIGEIVSASSFIIQYMFESLTLASVVSTASSYSRTLFENIVISDTISQASTFSRTLFDAITMSGSVSPNKLGVTQKFLYEGVTISEQNSVYSIFQRVLSEGITIDELISTASAFYRSLGEVITISCSLDLVSSYARTMFEIVSLAGLVTTTRTVSKELFESFTISFVYSTSSSFILSLSESIIVAESAATNFVGIWNLELFEAWILNENDVWGPYRPESTETTTTTNPNIITPHPSSALVLAVPPIAIVLGAALMILYISSIKPKPLKDTKGPREMMIKGIDTIERYGKDTKERLTSCMPIASKKGKKNKKKTTNKRRKKKGTVVRKVKRKVKKQK
jgi:hypothetical protein